jgi:hypothetical protein
MSFGGYFDIGKSNRAEGDLVNTAKIGNFSGSLGHTLQRAFQERL